MAQLPQLTSNGWEFTDMTIGDSKVIPGLRETVRHGKQQGKVNISAIPLQIGLHRI